VKESAKPKSPIQRDAADYLRAIRRLLQATPTKADLTSCTRLRCARYRAVFWGSRQQRAIAELVAAMKLSVELLGELQTLGFEAAEDQIMLDEPDPHGLMDTEAQELSNCSKNWKALERGSGISNEGRTITST
jgi:hypothetical protein